MAANFRISVHRNSGSLHMKLMGDFDGSSAWELLNVLKKCATDVCRVIIHTSALKSIYPFGLDTFQQNLRALEGYPERILFNGRECEPDRARKEFMLIAFVCNTLPPRGRR